MTLKVKYSDFQISTRSRTLPVPIADEAELEWLVLALLQPCFPVAKGIRLLGVTVSSLGEGVEPPTGQLSLAI